MGRGARQGQGQCRKPEGVLWHPAKFCGTPLQHILDGDPITFEDNWFLALQIDPVSMPSKLLLREMALVEPPAASAYIIKWDYIGSYIACYSNRPHREPVLTLQCVGGPCTHSDKPLHFTERGGCEKSPGPTCLQWLWHSSPCFHVGSRPGSCCT